MSADFDPLKTSRINTLHAGIEALDCEADADAFLQRDAFYQAIADINIGWVTRSTEFAIAEAVKLVQRRRRAA